METKDLEGSTSKSYIPNAYKIKKLGQVYIASLVILI